MTTSKEININGEVIPVQEEQILIFQTEIERRVQGDSISYIEAVSEYCEEHDVDYDSIVNLLSGKIKHQIHLEASEFNLLKEKTPSLEWL